MLPKICICWMSIKKQKCEGGGEGNRSSKQVKTHKNDETEKRLFPQVPIIRKSYSITFSWKKIIQLGNSI